MKKTEALNHIKNLASNIDDPQAKAFLTKLHKNAQNYDQNSEFFDKIYINCNLYIDNNVVANNSSVNQPIKANNVDQPVQIENAQTINFGTKE